MGTKKFQGSLSSEFYLWQRHSDGGFCSCLWTEDCPLYLHLKTPFSLLSLLVIFSRERAEGSRKGYLYNQTVSQEFSFWPFLNDWWSPPKLYQLPPRVKNRTITSMYVTRSHKRKQTKTFTIYIYTWLYWGLWHHAAKRQRA